MQGSGSCVGLTNCNPTLQASHTMLHASTCYHGFDDTAFWSCTLTPTKQQAPTKQNPCFDMLRHLCFGPTVIFPPTQIKAFLNLQDLCRRIKIFRSLARCFSLVGRTSLEPSGKQFQNLSSCVVEPIVSSMFFCQSTPITTSLHPSP